jgi:hypothetical protein
MRKRLADSLEPLFRRRDMVVPDDVSCASGSSEPLPSV